MSGCGSTEFARHIEWHLIYGCPIQAGHEALLLCTRVFNKQIDGEKDTAILITEPNVKYTFTRLGRVNTQYHGQIQICWFRAMQDLLLREF